MLYNKLFSEEKFIIRSTMSQDDILRILKENVQNDIPPTLFFPLKHKYFRGKIDGYKFGIRRIRNDRHTFPFIQGEIKGNYIFSTINSTILDKEKKEPLAIYLYFIIDSIFVVALLFGVLFLFDLFKHGLNIDFRSWFPWLMFFILMIFILPFRAKIDVSNEKLHLKKIFNGTIEK